MLYEDIFVSLQYLSWSYKTVGVKFFIHNHIYRKRISRLWNIFEFCIMLSLHIDKCTWQKLTRFHIFEVIPKQKGDVNLWKQILSIWKTWEYLKMLIIRSNLMYLTQLTRILTFTRVLKGNFIFWFNFTIN